MVHCPICHAVLKGADSCRRCRAELKTVQDLERRSQQLAGAALHCLALGDTPAASQLLRRARTIHATAELQILSRIVAAQSS
jgi:hypothetical protein